MINTDLLNAYNASSYFSENLIKLRKNLGLTQQQVAAKLGIDRTTYTKYETGVSEPSFEMLIRLSQLLGISLDELFGAPVDDRLLASVSDSGIDNLSPDEQQLIAAYRSLTEDKKQRIIDDLKNVNEPE